MNRGLTNSDGGVQVDGDSNLDCLSGLGFNVLHRFEEVNCDVTPWTMAAHSRT